MTTTTFCKRFGGFKGGILFGGWAALLAAVALERLAVELERIAVIVAVSSATDCH